MSARRSSQTSTVGEQRSTLRVRNSETGVVYHLVFGGNFRKLTGEQLKRHLEGICLIPAEQQRLSFNGISINGTSTSATLGLHDNALLELHTGRDHNGATPSYSVNKNREGYDMAYGNPVDEHLNVSGGGGGELQRSANQVTPGWQQTPRSHMMQHQGGKLHNTDRKSGVSQSTTGIRPPGNFFNFVSCDVVPPGNHDPVEAVIEEDTIGDIDAAMAPLHGADVEDARQEQMEYLWMMEQMRFETERMNRERELLRRRQELEYEADVLERERIIVGRRTVQERRKLLKLQKWIQEEMMMEAQLLHIRDNVDDGYAAVGDGNDDRQAMGGTCAMQGEYKGGYAAY